MQIRLFLAGLCAVVGVGTPVCAELVTENRQIKDYEGLWSGVQSGSVTYRLKDGTFTAVKVSLPDFQKWVGQTHVRNIAAKSASFTYEPDGYSPKYYQVFSAECAVHEAPLMPGNRWLPCVLALYDSSSKYPPVTRRFEIKLASLDDMRELQLKVLYGFFDQLKPGN